MLVGPYPPCTQTSTAATGIFEGGVGNPTRYTKNFALSAIVDLSALGVAAGQWQAGTFVGGGWMQVCEEAVEVWRQSFFCLHER